MANIDGINISFSEVRSTATAIRNHNTKLTQYLETIKTTINGLSESWQSDASETIRGKINGMEPHFEEYKNVIESYAKFLEDTVATFENTENTINSNANSFQ